MKKILLSISDDFHKKLKIDFAAGAIAAALIGETYDAQKLVQLLVFAIENGSDQILDGEEIVCEAVVQ